MKNYNVVLICLFLVLFTFPSKNLEEKLILEKEENYEDSNLRVLDGEEAQKSTPEYHKSSGGLSGGAVAGIVVAAVVVVAVAVVLAVVLKGVVFAATAVGVTTTSAVTAGAGAGGASAAGGLTQSSSAAVVRF